jgi:alkanesulfonate monooxygenase SsuD/methylene tetrahydromethanopterin reductase-like flavin-dependent oxidoreductase (luciferase family)
MITLSTCADRNSHMDLKFGITAPATLWRKNLSDKQAMLHSIHNHGFDHVFLADHVSFRNGAGTDGFVGAAGLSQLHDELGVMISIYLLPLRHPLPVARQLATMQELAPERMIFGVGVGGEDRHEIEVCGVDPRTRGARTNESLEIIRRLLDGESVTYAGDHFQLQDAIIKPVVKPRIPIIVGGRSDAALTRAGRLGDGWVGVWCSQARYQRALNIIEEAAQASGRNNINWLHGYQPWVGVDSDQKRARAVVKDQMEAFYKVPFEKFERYTPYGTPAEVAEQLAGYAAAGCRMFNIKVCARHPDEEINRGGEVIGELQNMLNLKQA